MSGEQRGMEIDNCTRTMVTMEGEHWYLTIGDDFVIATIPRENDPAMAKTREIVETLCNEISTIMQQRKVASELLEEC